MPRYGIKDPDEGYILMGFEYALTTSLEKIVELGWDNDLVLGNQYAFGDHVLGMTS